jgi:hypothetical protein
LIGQKSEWKRYSQLDTFRAIESQIQEKMWEAAVGSIQENIEGLREELATSPWEKITQFDAVVQIGEDLDAKRCQPNP